MPSHHETRTLPHTPEKIFDLVAGVEHYQEFLPWCVGSRVNWRRGNQFNADVLIGYKMLRERFNSTVTLTPHSRIDVHYESGPFTDLTQYWLFRPVPQQAMLHCETEFFISFSFRSKLLDQTFGLVFAEATKRMMHAFETRAARTYG